jgi:hypothetical protein
MSNVTVTIQHPYLWRPKSGADNHAPGYSSVSLVIKLLPFQDRLSFMQLVNTFVSGNLHTQLTASIQNKALESLGGGVCKINLDLTTNYNTSQKHFIQ